jgi:hypothetical protein
LLLLLQPTAELAAHRLQQPAGVFVAAGIDQLEIVQQAGLDAEQIDPSGGGFKQGKFVAAPARGDQGFQNGVEITYDPIPEGEFLVAGQAIEERHKPLDQIGGGLQDRQFATAGVEGRTCNASGAGAAVGRSGQRTRLLGKIVLSLPPIRMAESGQ